MSCESRKWKHFEVKIFEAKSENLVSFFLCLIKDSRFWTGLLLPGNDYIEKCMFSGAGVFYYIKERSRNDYSTNSEYRNK
jgi:hypothetical protein